MRLARVLPAFFITMSSNPAAAQQPVPAPVEVIRLVGGSGIVGRVTSVDNGKIHMVVDGVGEVVIDSAAVASRSPVPPPPPQPSPWSGTFTGSVTNISTVAPGIAGSTLGAQLTLGVARNGTRSAISLDGNLSYWRRKPDSAAVDQWGLTLTGRRFLAPRWLVMGRSQYEVNHVQYVEYRSTTIAGLGYLVVKSKRVTLLVAPGLGFGKSAQTAYGRVLSFAAGVQPGVEGAITGVHDMLTVRLTPTLGFQQDLHYFWSLSHRAFRQAEFNAKLLGMVTPHFGLSIAFKEQFDTSLPPQVNRNLRTLISGVQLKL